MKSTQSSNEIEANGVRDIQILRQLYHGGYLNDSELERAYKLLYLLRTELKSRHMDNFKKRS